MQADLCGKRMPMNKNTFIVQQAKDAERIMQLFAQLYLSLEDAVALWEEYSRETGRLTLPKDDAKLRRILVSNSTLAKDYVLRSIENTMERWHLGRENDDEALEQISKILKASGRLNAFKDDTI